MPALDCPVQTFREQVPGVVDRYQRPTTRLAGQADEVLPALVLLAGLAGVIRHRGGPGVLPWAIVAIGIVAPRPVREAHGSPGSR